MFKLIKEFISLLTKKQRKQLYALQFLVIIMSFTEIIGIGSIVPFMAVVGDSSILTGEGILASVYDFSGLKEEKTFLIYLGLLVLLCLAIATIVSTFTVWKLTMFTTSTGVEISDRLYKYYINQNWLFHSTGSSAQLTKQITIESERLISGVIQPLMQINAKAMLAIFLLTSVCVYEPIVAISGFLLFSILYGILYKLNKRKLHKNGKLLSIVTQQRFRLMSEAFGGIQDVLLLGRQQYFVEQFEKASEQIAYARGFNTVIGSAPRYFIELIAFGSIVALVVYLVDSRQGNLGNILPLLSFYALAGFKLLPTFQQIYTSMVVIKSNVSAFGAIKTELENSQSDNYTQSVCPNSKLVFDKNIVLKNISFSYPSKSETALKSLSLTIPAKNSIGIVGPSGSGKSTLISILTGLVEPIEGQLIIDNSIVNIDNRRAWQNLIGFVPQSIFLTEGSIKENIAFGLPQNEINIERIHEVLKLAQLSELIETLEEGINTLVGERGVQLSGGQRQRIGIARALYNDPEVLIFDEATSALDGITEKLIMEAIQQFGGSKTIILVAHRLQTVRMCDQIFFLDKGHVSCKGTYEELLSKSEHFRRMAELT